MTEIISAQRGSCTTQAQLVHFQPEVVVMKEVRIVAAIAACVLLQAANTAHAAGRAVLGG